MGNGFVWIDQLRQGGRRESAIRYTMKYITKEVARRTQEGEDVRGKRFFFTSNNLLKPVATLGEKAVSIEDIIFKHMEDMIRDGSYDLKNECGDRINHVEYAEYKKELLNSANTPFSGEK